MITRQKLCHELLYSHPDSSCATFRADATEDLSAIPRREENPQPVNMVYECIVESG